MGYGIKVLIEGDYALFTRPELKVERYSYDFITPSQQEAYLNQSTGSHRKNGESTGSMC